MSAAVSSAYMNAHGFCASISNTSCTLHDQVEVLDMEELGMEASQSSSTNFCSWLSR